MALTAINRSRITLSSSFFFFYLVFFEKHALSLWDLAEKFFMSKSGYPWSGLSRFYSLETKEAAVGGENHKGGSPRT